MNRKIKSMSKSFKTLFRFFLKLLKMFAKRFPKLSIGIIIFILLLIPSLVKAIFVNLNHAISKTNILVFENSNLTTQPSASITETISPTETQNEPIKEESESIEITPSPTPEIIEIIDNSPKLNYKASGMPDNGIKATVSELDKNPTAFEEKYVDFDCEILSFVKDDSGKVSHYNCSDPEDLTSSVLIETIPEMAANLHSSDIVNIYGLFDGVTYGSNAFGVTVTKTLIFPVYTHDKTNNFKDF